MDLHSLLIRSRWVVLYALYPHLMALLQIHCHNLLDLWVRAFNGTQGLDLANRGLLPQSRQSVIGHSCNLLRELRQKDALVLLLLLLYLGHHNRKVILLLLLHRLRQLLILLVTQRHRLRVLNLLPRLVFRLLFFQCLYQWLILLQNFLRNDPFPLDVDMLKVVIVFDLLEVGLFEDAAEDCFLSLLFLLEDFLFFIILLLVLLQLSLQLSD